MIKVAFFAEVLQENYDGAVRTMYQIINRIPSKEFEYLFFAGVKPTKDIGHKIISLPKMIIPINWNYEMSIPLISDARIKYILNRFKPDVIHIATPSSVGNFAMKYARKRRIPVLSIYHTHFLSYVDYYLRKIPALIQPIKKSVAQNLKRFYNKCDIVYMPTKAMENDLTKIGLDAKLMKIWQRGINTQLFNPIKRDPEFLQKIVQNDHKNVLFVSRLVWEKNLDTLIRVYDKMQSASYPMNLIIAGDGVAKTALQQKMPNAHFLGNLSHEDLAKVYASSDVFLFTSNTETYGNVVIEAMASGLPTVVANGGGPTSFVKQRENGILCSAYDENEYLASILALLTNDDFRKSIIANGLKLTKNMDWNHLAASYFDDIKLLSQRQSIHQAK